MLVKASEHRIQHWYKILPYITWADRITTRISTGHSPYYMAHGVEPVMPFDLAEATYLSPSLSKIVSTDDLIILRARQLEKRPDDLQKMHDLILKSRNQSATQFNKTFHSTIHSFDFSPGQLVLVRNSRNDTGLPDKTKPRYLGPYIVISKHSGGSYTLAEMDGTISKLHFAAKRVIPYFLRTSSLIPESSDDINTANVDQELDS
ncbi:hypothetical protein SISSUDRAFT_1072615 [Sistotremastrum suecicum HHB10207 ss-3]|uniref:Integrase zinc-binding domain-containing protein n=1 Tax=Sistotremastrum suecicum HHB10207 ss-3 TaxID=1314776 RepID=A0A165WWL0_9AGAM|nr:hypothetical protein SISSUDRAFT_1072615 [Sistotremastrum suecicum HHB10207 ss-3]